MRPTRIIEQILVAVQRYEPANWKVRNLVDSRLPVRLFLKAFLLMWLFTAVGIILHELSHHLFGIPSAVSLARNWPLVPITAENKNTAIIGSLAGPTANLLLGYLSMLVYKLVKREGALKTLAVFFGLANSFLIFFATIVNLLVDLLSGNRGNDLQVVSELAGINVFILPAIFAILSLVALRFFRRKLAGFTNKHAVLNLLLITASLLGGALLMLLDHLLNIRFQIV